MILARFRDHFDRACVPGRLRDPKCGLRGLILESILAHFFMFFRLSSRIGVRIVLGSDFERRPPRLVLLLRSARSTRTCEKYYKIQ